MFFATGGKLKFMSKDWRSSRVELSLGFWTRNYVGTIFGGSQFSALDPFPMIQLLNILGSEYIVWDKAGHIQFKKPGKGKLTAQVTYTDEELTTIIDEVATKGRINYDKTLTWIDKNGDVVSIIQKTLYIASKEHYKNK